jgi:hypothetical protein
MKMYQSEQVDRLRIDIEKKKKKLKKVEENSKTIQD